MDFIQGKPRSQLVLIESSLEEKIEQDNPVRVIDLFVDSCKLEKFGFTHVRHAKEGRPPYHPGDLLKLFIYGYLNRIRSSRTLEKECKRNLELMWLLNELTPDHNTIANFRKDNPKAIKQVFRKMVTMCKKLDLIGGKVIATDGTKLRAQNSKKNNYNQRKINDHLKFIETRLNEYLDALANMTARTKSILGHNEFTELADKGYHTGEEIRRCHELGVETLVAIPKTPVSSQAPNPDYNRSKFHYDKENDYYLCPQGQKLTSNGTWYHNHPYRTKHFKTKACLSCPVKSQCTVAAKGRVIERKENIEATQKNRKAIEQNKELYKRRQEIVEHPFGTIKRQWGFDYTLMKGKKKVDGEVGLIFIAYLFTRLLTILGPERLTEVFRTFILRFFDTFFTAIAQTVNTGRISATFSIKRNLYRICLNSL